MNFRGIVFDKDGTLIDFQRSWVPVFRLAALDFAAGDPAVAADLLRLGGYDAGRQRVVGGSLMAVADNRVIAAAWAERLGAGDDDGRHAARLERILCREGARHAVAVERLAATLSRLHRDGLRLGIATSDSLRGIRDTLAPFDVLRHFEFLAGYDSGHGLKPGGGMVRAFCAEFDLDAGAVVVVGDNRHDIEMGRDAGAGLCVGVLTGTGTRAELGDCADVVIDGIGELPALLSR